MVKHGVTGNLLPTGQPPMKAAKYPKLELVRGSLKIRWYRCPMRKGSLKLLMERSDKKGFIQALGHLGLWAMTGLMVHSSWQRSNVACCVIAMWFHGIVGSTFVYGCHELGHGTVFATKWLNTLFLWIFSVLFWWNPYDYAASHTYHHRYSQFQEGDRENLPPLVPALDKFTVLQLATCNVFSTPGNVFGKGGMISTILLTIKSALGGVASFPSAAQHEWLKAVHADQPEEFAKSMHASQLIVLFHTSIFGYAFMTNQWIVFLIVSLHQFFSNWLSYLVGSCQHMGLKSNVPDFRLNSRTILLPRGLEFLFWNMNFHIEHHMFANVPFYNLQALHNEVRLYMPKPRTLFEAWREMRETYRRQLIDCRYEYETPLPNIEPKIAGGGLEIDELAYGLGDLAPAGLRKR